MAKRDRRDPGRRGEDDGGVLDDIAQRAADDHGGDGVHAGLGVGVEDEPRERNGTGAQAGRGVDVQGVDVDAPRVGTTPEATLPTDAELERAITSVTGVASATVTRAQDTGRGRLRIRLLPGEDATHVAWTVSATLRERFGIVLDPEAIHVGVSTGDLEAEPDASATIDVTAHAETASGGGTPHVDAAAAASAPQAAPVAPSPHPDIAGAADIAPDDVSDAPGGASVGPAEPRGAIRADLVAPRPLIRDLDVQRRGAETEVAVTLRLNDVDAVGRVHAVPTSRGVLRGIAEATVAALRDLATTPLVIGVDSVSNVTTSAETSTINVLLTYLTEHEEEILVGASLIRGDPEHAVMRATLDALNRRLLPVLAT